VGHAVILPPMVQRGDEGLERRVASSPSPQHPPTEHAQEISFEVSIALHYKLLQNVHYS
jgi:hypothetical protein